MLVDVGGRLPNGNRQAPIIHLQLNAKKKKRYDTNTLHVYAWTQARAKNAQKGGYVDGKEKVANH